LLQHTGGFDRAKSFDPMFRPVIIAKDLGVPPPAGPEHVIRYMLGQPLDFDPGSRYAYSNYGYCVLGRIIECVSGQSYESFVRNEVLKPLGATATKLGKTLERAAGEVKYRDAKPRQGTAILGPDFGKLVPMPYGAWQLEAMDAHGGWISTATDLVRFASAFDRPEQCPLLKPASIDAMFARPHGRAGYDDAGKPLSNYYALGWNVRPQGAGRTTTHMGSLDGTATVLVRRHDCVDWAVLFNGRSNAKGEYVGKLIEPLMNEAATKVKRWPMGK
jgi:N-acyl-D-amino-acid deacylase